MGYPKGAFTQVKEKIANKQVKRKNNKKDTTKKSKGYVHIQFVEGIAEKAKRIFRRHDIATVMSPHTALRKLLVHPIMIRGIHIVLRGASMRSRVPIAMSHMWVKQGDALR